MAKLPPPILPEVLPAVYLERKEDQNYIIEFEFYNNRSVTFSDIYQLSAIVKYPISQEVIASQLYSANYQNQDVYLNGVKSGRIAVDKNKIKPGNSYLFSIAYINKSTDSEGKEKLETGYYSTPALIKCTDKPSLSVVTEPNRAIGAYSNTDVTEVAYSYQFTTYDSNNNIIEQTDWSVDWEASTSIGENRAFRLAHFYPRKVFDSNVQKIEFAVKTINGLEESVKENITFSSETLPQNNYYLNLKAENNFDDGSIDLGFSLQTPYIENSKTKSRTQFTSSQVLKMLQVQYGDDVVIRKNPNNENGEITYKLWFLNQHYKEDETYEYGEFLKAGDEVYKNTVYYFVDDNNNEMMYEFPDDHLLTAEEAQKNYYLSKRVPIKKTVLDFEYYGNYSESNNPRTYYTKQEKNSITFDFGNADKEIIVNSLNWGNDAVTFRISRKAEDEKYYTKLTKATFNSYHAALSWNYRDFTVEQGKKYEYKIQLANNAEMKAEVTADFEDTFISDGKRQLKVRFNPKISSFKTTKQESKTDTIGSQFPFIFRNGATAYKEFPVSGLISFQMDENRMFMYEKENWDYILSRYSKREGSETGLFAADATGNINSATYQFKNEREFKLLVSEWLTNNSVKLFRSPAEGNYLIKILNVSLSPEDRLGRMIHTFSGTAYEVEELSIGALIDHGFINPDEEKFSFEQKTSGQTNFLNNYKYFRIDTRQVATPKVWIFRIGENDEQHKIAIPSNNVFTLTTVNENAQLPNIYYSSSDNYTTNNNGQKTFYALSNDVIIEWWKKVT